MLQKQKVIYDASSGLWHNISDPNFGQLIEKRKYPKLNIRGFEPKNTFYQYYGSGKEFVYIMYETESRVEAILRDRDSWLLKVGRTNDIKRRVAEISQSGPNSLVVGMVFKTNSSKALEIFIHKRLATEGRKYDLPGRKEWFNSNLTDIHSIWINFKKDER